MLKSMKKCATNSSLNTESPPTPTPRWLKIKLPNSAHNSHSTKTNGRKRLYSRRNPMGSQEYPNQSPTCQPRRLQPHLCQPHADVSHGALAFSYHRMRGRTWYRKIEPPLRSCLLLQHDHPRRLRCPHRFILSSDTRHHLPNPLQGTRQEMAHDRRSRLHTRQSTRQTRLRNAILQPIHMGKHYPLAQRFRHPSHIRSLQVWRQWSQPYLCPV